MKIYVYINEDVKGPFEKKEVFAMLAEGRITSQDCAFCEGDSEWVTVNDILKKNAPALFSVDQIEAAQQKTTPVSFVVPNYPQREIPKEIVPQRSFSGLIGKLAVVALIFGVCFYVFSESTLKQKLSSAWSNDSSALTKTNPSHLTETPSVSQESAPPSDQAPEVSTSSPQPESTDSVTVPSSADAEQMATVSPVTDSPMTEESQKPTPSPTAQRTIGFSRSASDFFKIKKIACVERSQKDEFRVAWLQLPGTRFTWKAKQFVPYIEVQLQAAEQYLAKDTFIHVHFFDSDKKLLETLSEPVISWFGPKIKYSPPALIPKIKVESVYFPLPACITGKQWSAIVVFGDQNSATSSIYPSNTSMFGRDYPDKELVGKRVPNAIEREAAIDPVTQVVMETLNPKQPTMTLFMRLPIGARSGKEAKGVLALCLLAKNPTEIQQMLQRCDRDEDGRIFKDINTAFQILEKLIDPSIAEDLKNRIAARTPDDDAKIVEDMQNILNGMVNDPDDKILTGCRNRVKELVGQIYRNNLVKLADRHQLAILAWGSRRLWDPKLSFDEQSRKANREMDETFDDVARAWEKGVDKLSKQFGFPSNEFLLTGMSGAAQYACRLALRKPERFLAVHVHIPSSFDKPTPEASKVLWLLTTGEKEGGYPSATRFFNECKGLGYPMIFKGIPGLGHAGSRIADQLGLEFFEYALSIKESHEKLTANRSASLLQQSVGLPEPWPDSFKKPAAIGDILNQDTFPANEADFVPQNFRVALPTASITAAWKQ